jgi:hypothetical protein
VLFDELHADAVIKNKKIFQSSLDCVCLGTSQTNVNILRLWMWQVRMVVASNCWKHELVRASVADSGWLEVKFAVRMRGRAIVGRGGGIAGEQVYAGGLESRPDAPCVWVRLHCVGLRHWQQPQG